MPLENLVSTIETLKERINTHYSDLAASEARTRAALIDPVLTALGWDTSDPGLVMVEQRLRGGKADYALLKPNGNPISIVEAKALGSQLHRVTDQLIRYAFAEGLPYAVSTDGDWWQVYDLTKPNIQIDDRLILKISISDNATHECAMKLLLLWHPNFASGTPVQAKIPSTSHSTNDQNGNDVITPDTSAQETPSSFVDSGWISLEDCDLPPKTPGPLKVRFPDGIEQKIKGKSWNGLFVATVQWLWEEKFLDSTKIPVKNSDEASNSWFILHTRPEFSPGYRMPRYKKIDTTPLYFSTDCGMQGFINYTNRVLKHCNVNPAEVYILPRQ